MLCSAHIKSEYSQKNSYLASAFQHTNKKTPMPTYCSRAVFVISKGYHVPTVPKIKLFYNMYLFLKKVISNPVCGVP